MFRKGNDLQQRFSRRAFPQAYPMRLRIVTVECFFYRSTLPLVGIARLNDTVGQANPDQRGKGFKILVFNAFGLHQPKADRNPDKQRFLINFFRRGRPKRGSVTRDGDS